MCVTGETELTLPGESEILLLVADSRRQTKKGLTVRPAPEFCNRGGHRSLRRESGGSGDTGAIQIRNLIRIPDSSLSRTFTLAPPRKENSDEEATSPP